MPINRGLCRRAIAAAVLFVNIAACAASRSPRTAAADDGMLKTRVETALRNSPGVHADEVTTEVTGGVATLSGTVHNQAELDATLAAARRVEGLKDIRSNLQVR